MGLISSFRGYIRGSRHGWFRQDRSNSAWSHCADAKTDSAEQREEQETGGLKPRVNTLHFLNTQRFVYRVLQTGPQLNTMHGHGHNTAPLVGGSTAFFYIHYTELFHISQQAMAITGQKHYSTLLTVHSHCVTSATPRNAITLSSVGIAA